MCAGVIFRRNYLGALESFMPLFLKRSIPDPAFIMMNNPNWQKPNQTKPNKETKHRF